MKTTHLLSILACLVAPLVAADKPEAKTPPPTAILLVAATPLDLGMLERVKATMQVYLRVVVARTNSAEATTVVEAQKAAGATSAPEFCRIVFWRGNSKLVDGFLLAPDSREVLVDVTPLQADKPSAELLERRLVRQAMRGTGLLLGLDYVAGPPCTLKRVKSLKELDALSANFSPPAQGKFENMIQLEGVELLEQ